MAAMSRWTTTDPFVRQIEQSRLHTVFLFAFIATNPGVYPPKFLLWGVVEYLRRECSFCIAWISSGADDCHYVTRLLRFCQYTTAF
jgi:hypothetical protein